MFDPDLLGDGVKIEQGSNILNQIFNLFVKYVWKVHSDEFIRKCLRYSAGRSFLDVIGPDDIAYIVSIIKNSNSKDMWDQDRRMQEMGAQAIGSQEKKLKLLFTSGSCQKRTLGKSLWNLEGMKYFHRVETKWRQVYDSKKDMRVLYNGWERWITTTGSDIKIGDGSKKTFKTAMGTWHEDSSQTLRMEEEQDDEETWGLEGGYSSDRGRSRQSLDYHSGKLGENSSAESEGEQEEEGEDSDGENEKSPRLFAGEKAGNSNMNSDNVVDSPTKNTRKRKSTIPAVDSPAMATRGKRGHK
jgi:hypothetical protein